MLRKNAGPLTRHDVFATYMLYATGLSLLPSPLRHGIHRHLRVSQWLVNARLSAIWRLREQSRGRRAWRRESMAFVSRKRVGCNGRKAVDQELCETGGGGGGNERGAEEEQAGRVVSRGGRGGGKESEAHLQRRLVRAGWSRGGGRGGGEQRRETRPSATPSASEIGLLRLLP